MHRLHVFLAVVLLVALPAAPAAAHRTGMAVNPDETTPIEYATDNVELVAHHYFPEATDMMFQRRDGRQMLEGEVVDGVRDYLFVGGDAKSDQEDGAVQVFDVTDPTSPVHLVEIPCQGYHSDIGVYENLLFQGFGSGGSNGGCGDEAARFDPEGIDEPGSAGIRVFDITDPANPTVVDFISARDGLSSGGTHNLSIHAEAGLMYLATAGFTPTGVLAIVDVKTRPFEITEIPVQDISPGSADTCHDIAFDFENDLLFCPAIASTHIWDISDPMSPTHVSTIRSDKISIHHGARLSADGTTLVLNDEHAGAADQDLPAGDDAGAGANGCLGDPTTGGLWFYDISNPTAPVLNGAFAPTLPQPLASPCTSHFYNFVPNSKMTVTGWYEAGIVVSDHTLPVTPATSEVTVFLPELGNFWSAYYWHGYLYGASRTRASKGFGGGLWIVKMEGLEDLEPYVNDEGTSWVRWTSQLEASGPVEPSPTPEPAVEPADAPLPTTGGGLAVLAALAVLGAGTAGRRRRR